MTDLRKAANMALDYIKDIRDHCACEGIDCEKENALVAKLEAALAQPDETETLKRCLFQMQEAAKALAQPEQDAGKCGCGANLYIDENGKPCSKAQPEQDTHCKYCNGLGCVACDARFLPVFKEVPIGEFALRFYRTDHVWTCTVTEDMLDRVVEIAKLAQPEQEELIQFKNGKWSYIKKPWVGLTDELLSETYNDLYTQYTRNDVNIADFILIARAIELQIKDKNT